MQVVSPYGKDPIQELQSVYGFASPDQAAHGIVQHVREHYALPTLTLESLHLAYGLTANLTSDGASYYLKFASRGMHSHPEQLFPWLAHLRRHGMPVPDIIPSRDGAWFLAPLPRSTYDVVYLYPHPVLGSHATWTSKWAERGRLHHRLSAAPGVSRELVLRAMDLIEQTGPSTLSSSIIHGNFRLCHVLFHHTQITGIIDVDQSTTGDRWVDVCYGLMSGAVPEAGALLPFPVVRAALRHYHQHYPFSDIDQASLKATFAYATLETIADLLPGVDAGTATHQDIRVTQDLFDAIYATPNDELLAPQ